MLINTCVSKYKLCFVYKILQSLKRITFWYFVDVLKNLIGYTHSKVGHQVMFLEIVLEIELENMATVMVTSNLYDYNYNYYCWYSNKFGN